MSTRRIGIAAAIAVVAALVGGAATWAFTGDESATPGVQPPNPASALKTEFPGLEHATGEPQLPGIRTADPEPGAVATVAGPFDDRFTLSELDLGADAVTGRLHITSDVSDLLELQVLAGFYDARGRLLGTGRFVHHDLEERQHSGPPSELERFSVTIPPRLRDRVASAAVGVPVLVNE